MQVPVKEREKLLKKEGLDPTRLTNLTLVYKVQEVALHLHHTCKHMHKQRSQTCSHSLQACTSRCTPNMSLKRMILIIVSQTQCGT